MLHDLDHAAAVADELHLIADGRIRARGAPAEVLRAELLTEVYGIAVEVDRDPRTGAVHVRPLRRRAREPVPATGGEP